MRQPVAHTAPIKAMTVPKISVVICTRNRAALLVPCLDSVLQQTLPRDQYEILVVDGSTDDTPAVVARYATQGVRYLHEPVPGLSRARNTGWRHACGQYVGYLDDDAQAVTGWLESALAAFEHVQPEPGWVGGPIDLNWEAPGPAWLDISLQECLGRLDLGVHARWLERRERLGGGNSFFNRAILEQAGGFDERLSRVGDLLLSGDETQLQLRLETAGHRLYYEPGVRILHYVPRERTLPWFFYRRYYWGGVTDELIRRTLRQQGVGSATIELPSAHTAGSSSVLALFGRIARHTLAICGVGSMTARIHGRIYYAYVAGRLVGLVRWRALRQLPSKLVEGENIHVH